MQFGLLKAEEVARMSVVKVDNVRIYSDRGVPNFGAINDPRMGTMEKERKCLTCKGSKY
jgi:DNA-directed RNA polymerase II subunit RPB1